MTGSVPVLVGPTASGKTAVALSLARLFPCEIISADSRQIYRHLNIGTAKPTPQERALVPHHFIDVVEPNEEFTAGRYGEEGRAVIEAIVPRGVTPLVVGGSGLYIRSLIDGLFEGPGADPEFRDVMEERLRRGELPALVEELRKVDPVTASRIDPTKPRRIVRALEIFHATGRPLSAVQRDERVQVNFTPRLFGLLWKRDALYARIDARCERMISDGLLREVENLRELGFGRELNSLNTVGYREAFDLLDGKIDRKEMLRLFKQNTRHYAKRQMTWFRRDSRIHWIAMHEGKEPRDASGEIIRELKNSP